jgi:hypothetical protein
LNPSSTNVALPALRTLISLYPGRSPYRPLATFEPLAAVKPLAADIALISLSTLSASGPTPDISALVLCLFANQIKKFIVSWRLQRIEPRHERRIIHLHIRNRRPKAIKVCTRIIGNDQLGDILPPAYSRIQGDKHLEW